MEFARDLCYGVRREGVRGCRRSRRRRGACKRRSARRKSEVVPRLLRGEDIGELSREIRVPPPELERWRRLFPVDEDP